MPKKKTKVKSAAAGAAKSGAKGAKVNKSAFVRSQPMSMTAREVVAKAKAQGITLSEPLVYVVRAKSKQKKGKRGPGRPRKNAAPAAAATSTSSAAVEGLLRAAAAEIGLSRAMAILGEQRDAVRAVLGN